MKSLVSSNLLGQMSPKRVSVVAMIGIIVSFSFFLLGTHSREALIVYSSDFLGLLSHLNILYWLSVFLIVIVLVILWWFNVHYAKILSVTAVIVLGVILLSISVFIQEHASFFVSYYPAGEVQSVLQTHHVDPLRQGQFISYHYWPAIHLFSATNMLILGVGLETLLKYIPLFWVIVYVLLTYYVANNLGLNVKQWLVMGWLLVTAQWVGQYYYSAQSLAILMYLIVVIVLFREKISWEYTLIFIIISWSLIITHSLTSLAVVMGGSVVAIYKKRIRVVTILSGILFLVFYLYISKKVFDFGVQEFIGKLLSKELNQFWESSEFTSEIMNYSKMICHYAKIFFAISYTGFLASAVFAFYKNQKNWLTEKRNLFYVAGLWMIGIGTLLLFQYGTEMQYRIYLYATVIIAFLLVISYPRSKLIVIYAIFLTAIHFPAHYGTYSYEQTLKTELAGARFLAYQVKPSTAYSYRFYPYVRYYDPQNLFVRCLTFAPQYAKNLNKDLALIPYISDSFQSHNYMNYAFEYDVVRGWLKNNDRVLELFYDNGSFWTYNNRFAAQW